MLLCNKIIPVFNDIPYVTVVTAVLYHTGPLYDCNGQYLHNTYSQLVLGVLDLPLD